MNDTIQNTPIRKTQAVIHLDEIKKNISKIHNRVGKDKAFLVLLKANAYGHGDIAIAKLAERLGLFGGGIACLEEGHRLRDFGITLPLLLLEDIYDDEVEHALQLDCKFTVSSYRFAQILYNKARKLDTKACVHINVDTGMGRLGIYHTEAEEAIKKIACLDNLYLEGLYTHFPSADEPHKEFSIKQISLFSTLIEKLRQQGITFPYIHTANSGALLNFPDQSSFSLIRPGISVFGLYPSEGVDRSLNLTQSMTLRTQLIKVARYPKGVPIGYGRTFYTKRPTILGIIPLGYGDGFPRVYSNNAQVLIQTRYAPIIGRVSMDLVAIDCTDLPSPPVPGDEVVIFGEQKYKNRNAFLSVDSLARQANTITYEVTTLLNRRIPRVYQSGGKTIAVDTQTNGYCEFFSVQP